MAAFDVHDARGVTCPLDAARLRDCLGAVEFYRAWYERSILGCATERWLALRSVEDFEEWLEEDAAHRDSAVGVFARYGRSIGLHKTGGGTPHLLSMGCYYDPEGWQPPFRDRRCLLPAGFYDGESKRIEPFCEGKISEDVSHAWYLDPGRPCHPWDSRTVPARRAGGPQYSYAKATRYDDRVVQLGPLADLVVGCDPLIASLFQAQGPNTWLRQFARFHRPVWVLESMRQTVPKLSAHLDAYGALPLTPCHVRPVVDGMQKKQGARCSQAGLADPLLTRLECFDNARRSDDDNQDSRPANLNGPTDAGNTPLLRAESSTPAGDVDVDGIELRWVDPRSY